jgi:large subunit ribosomal protein L20
MRVKGGFKSRRRHKRLLKQAEGFRARRSSCYKLAKRAVQKGMQHAYRARRAKKRDYRALWIARINAASRAAGLNYSSLVRGLKIADVQIDRKVLADLAMHNPEVFTVVVGKARAALN